MELLNACGKNNNAQLGICTALGDDNCINEAKKLSSDHLKKYDVFDIFVLYQTRP